MAKSSSLFINNLIAQTGQITSAKGTVNINSANIDVLTGMETLQFTGTSYTGTGTGTNQLRSTVQSSLTNNSIAALAGTYDALTGDFSLGSKTPNATLVAFDSNSGDATNYEAFLLLNKTSMAGSNITANNGGNVFLAGL